MLSIPLPNAPPLEFIRLPPGTFQMGQRGGRPNEEPVHRVVIPSDFYIGRSPVTQSQYRAMASQCLAELSAIPGNRGPNPSQLPASGDGDNHPVDSVSWDDAQCICQWLNRSKLLPAGWQASLPTEAHWEYACRAGTETLYSFGDREEDLRKYAWFDANAKASTHPVQELEKNDWGLYDMHGNVWEWCLDLYDPRAYRKRVDGTPAVLPPSQTIVETDPPPPWLQPLVNLLQRFANPNATDEERRITKADRRVLEVYGNLAEVYAKATPEWQDVVTACRDALKKGAWQPGYAGVAAGTLPTVQRWLAEFASNARRVVRGGSWFNSARGCRAAYRNAGYSWNRDWIQGFRVCLFSGPSSCPAQQSSAPGAGASSEPRAVDGAGRDAEAESSARGADDA